MHIKLIWINWNCVGKCSDPSAISSLCLSKIGIILEKIKSPSTFCKQVRVIEKKWHLTLNAVFCINTLQICWKFLLAADASSRFRPTIQQYTRAYDNLFRAIAEEPTAFSNILFLRCFVQTKIISCNTFFLSSIHCRQLLIRTYWKATMKKKHGKNDENGTLLLVQSQPQVFGFKSVQWRKKYESLYFSL